MLHAILLLCRSCTKNIYIIFSTVALDGWSKISDSPKCFDYNLITRRQQEGFSGVPANRGKIRRTEITHSPSFFPFFIPGNGHLMFPCVACRLFAWANACCSGLSFLLLTSHKAWELEKLWHPSMTLLHWRHRPNSYKSFWFILRVGIRGKGALAFHYFKSGTGLMTMGDRESDRAHLYPAWSPK